MVGPRVLEISCGTGYLLSRYAASVEAHGVDLNRRMLAIAGRNLRRAGASAKLVRANVERLPYRNASFDTLVVTMAFSGYPAADPALGEMTRVLRPGGRIVLIDIAPPEGGGWVGTALVALWKASGDLVRDMGRLFAAHALDSHEEEIGGWGSVHLFVVTKRAGPEADAAPRRGAGPHASPRE